ncbi:MAG TPA: hypothetical protein VI197_32430, partial [Polyangiaceae bacterium]
MPSTPESIAAAALWISASSLAWRLLGAWIRTHRSRRAYPRLTTDTQAGDARIHGSLLGLAAGDAVGLPAERLPRWLVRLRYPGGPRLR